jgi:hypothetical protein
MLYFHPWEFDPGQSRMPLKWLNRFRTYVGISRTRARLRCLLGNRRFTRAFEIAKQLDSHLDELPCYSMTSQSLGPACQAEPNETQFLSGYPALPNREMVGTMPSRTKLALDAGGP